MSMFIFKGEPTKGWYIRSAEMIDPRTNGPYILTDVLFSEPLRLDPQEFMELTRFSLECIGGRVGDGDGSLFLVEWRNSAVRAKDTVSFSTAMLRQDESHRFRTFAAALACLKLFRLLDKGRFRPHQSV